MKTILFAANAESYRLLNRESAGENRKEIIFALKKELGLDFGEIRKRLKEVTRYQLMERL